LKYAKVVVLAYFNLKPIKVKNNNPFQDEKYKEKLNSRRQIVLTVL